MNVKRKLVIMDFLQHTHEWLAGEMFEAICIATGGVLLLALALLALIYGSTPGASSFVIPFIVAALILIVGGVAGYRTNVKRIPLFSEQYKSNQRAFVTAEKARVETFDDIYRNAKIVSIISLIVGLGMAYFLKNPHLQSIGLALIVLAIATVFIDHFSKERAVEYYTHIQKYLKL